jgi:hypothetical protein
MWKALGIASIASLVVTSCQSHREVQRKRAFWADRVANESTLRTNLLSLAATQPRLLVIWGKYDLSFDRLNGNERADDHGERTQQYKA